MFFCWFQKKTDASVPGGADLLQIRPQRLLHFSPPPKKRPMVLQRGGVKFFANTSLALVAFFYHPQGMKILLKFMAYFFEISTCIFPPPFWAIKGVVIIQYKGGGCMGDA